MNRIIERRPEIFDPRLGLRRYFWDELSREQQADEFDTIINLNQQLLEGLSNEHTTTRHSDGLRD